MTVRLLKILVYEFVMFNQIRNGGCHDPKTFVKLTILLSFCLFLIVSCSAKDNSPNNISWMYPRSYISRGRKAFSSRRWCNAPDGTLIVADQRYGLAKIDLSGNVSPFGNFEALNYEHNPPKAVSGPNGVHTGWAFVVQPMCLMEKSIRHQCK